MIKSFPIKVSKLRNTFVEPVSQKYDDSSSLNIIDFPNEMREVIELDEELDRYFQFLSKLSRDELLAIIKYEVYNRILMQQDLKMMENK